MKKIIMFVSILGILFSAPVLAKAAENLEQDNHTFTQPFQNTTTSLTGTAVKATTYFTKIDYWDVKKATFNLNYQITQLENQQTSDVTVAVNGVKIHSWRPENKNGRQTETIDLPLNLLSGSNTLTIEGQIVNYEGDDGYRLIETPANWLTVYDGSNVNFQYDLKLPEDTIHSFYNHFVGADTIANGQSVVSVPENASDVELEAASYGISGFSRIITTSEQYLQLTSWTKNQTQPYQVIVATYKNLPEPYKKDIDEKKVENDAVIKFLNAKDQHILLVTSKNEKALLNAGRYLANQELMTQTEKIETYISENTDTFTSSLEFDGKIPFTTTGDQLIGAYHQEQVYFVSLPTDYNNINGSSVDLAIKYADNLDFDTSLVTVYVNDVPVGSQKLTASGANGDRVQLKLPDNLEVADSFVLKVAFDLNVKSPEVIRNGNTPWASIENTSSAFIKSEDTDVALFENYPNIFIANNAFSDLAIVLPEKMTDEYFKALSNVLNLLGNYAKDNTGNLTFYKDDISKRDLGSHNLIILGTPKDNTVVKNMNKDLYFTYNNSLSTFVSNEKLSIEPEYGKTLGTAQLMFSPFNSDLTALVLTSPSAEGVYLASTQLNSQKSVAIYKGDLIAVDSNYRRYDYRFKQEASHEKKNSLTSQIENNLNVFVYGLILLIVLAIVATSIYFISRKYTDNTKGGN